MIKETISYEDFDGNPQVATLHFNLTKTELADNLTTLKPMLDELVELFKSDGPEDPSRKLEDEEVRKLLAFVKLLLKLSYGVRSEDGQRFIKSEEVWTHFTQTPMYDSFLFSLFENPEKANRFTISLIPNGLVNEAERLNAAATPPVRNEEKTVEELKAELARLQATQ